MMGKTLLAQARRRFRAANNNQLAKVLGVTQANLAQVESRKKISERQIITLLKKVASHTKSTLGSNGVRPLFEYYPVSPSRAGTTRKEFVNKAEFNGKQVRGILESYGFVPLPVEIAEGGSGVGLACLA